MHISFDAIGVDTTQKELKRLVKQAQILAQKYDVVITNPPYMGNKGMSKPLEKYVTANYPDSKTDLFAIFIERRQKC